MARERKWRLEVSSKWGRIYKFVKVNITRDTWMMQIAGDGTTEERGKMIYLSIV